MTFIRLLYDGRAAGTLLLWTVNFMNLLNLYFLQGWLTTVVTDAGYPQTTAAMVASMVQVGGTVGAFTLGWFVHKWGFVPVLTTARRAGEHQHRCHRTILDPAGDADHSGVHRGRLRYRRTSRDQRTIGHVLPDRAAFHRHRRGPGRGPPRRDHRADACERAAGTRLVGSRFVLAAAVPPLIVAVAMLVWRHVGMPGAPVDAKTEVATH